MKKLMFLAITLCMIVLLTVVLSETILRLVGFKPWEYASLDNSEQVVHEFDSFLGWKNKAGQYLIPAYSQQGKDFQITFNDDGWRITGNQSVNTTDEIIIVGGSYTLGWGISDDETYSWKLQEKYPSLKVLNYGTDAYSTYQSLLVLERELPSSKSPLFVLYGFIDHHEVRNVAPANWLKILARYSKRSHIDVPYVTVDSNGMLIRHPSEHYIALPFRESLALIAFIEDYYMRLQSKDRASQKRLATEKLLIEMNRLSNLKSAQFLAVLLQLGPETLNHYLSFFQKNNIDYINCIYPIPPEMRVPGDMHPNGKIHSLYAECISEALNERLKHR